MAITFKDLKDAYTNKLKENIFQNINKNNDESSLSQKILISNSLIKIIKENELILESIAGKQLGQYFVDFINRLEEKKQSFKSNASISTISALQRYSEEGSYSDQLSIVDVEKSAEQILREVSATNFSIKEIGFTSKTYLVNSAYDYFKNISIFARNYDNDINCLNMKKIDSDSDDYFSEDYKNEGMVIYDIVHNEPNNSDTFLRLIKSINSLCELFMVVIDEDIKNSKIMIESNNKLNETLDLNLDFSFMIPAIIEETTYINGIFNQSYFKNISKKIADKYSEDIVAVFSSDIHDFGEYSYLFGEDSYLLRYSLQKIIKDNKINTVIEFDEIEDKYLLTLRHNAIFYLLQDFLLTNDVDIINGIKINENFNNGKLSYRLNNKDTMFIFPKEQFQNLNKEKAINIIIESLKEIVQHCSVENDLFVSTEGSDIKLSNLLINSYRRDYLLEKLSDEEEKINKNKKKI